MNRRGEIHINTHILTTVPSEEIQMALVCYLEGRADAEIRRKSNGSTGRTSE